MKKMLLIGAMTALAGASFGQGLVVMNSASANAYLRFSNTVDRTWAAGDAFWVGLYYAADAATLLSGGGTLATGGGTNNTGLAKLTTGVGAGFISTATFGGNRSIPGRSGQLTWFQLRAWSAGFNSYEQALSGPPTTLISVYSPTQFGPQYKAAPIVSAIPQDPPTPPSQIQWAPGITSSGGAVIVDLVPVPEPSSLAIGFLGLAGAILLRRRK